MTNPSSFADQYSWRACSKKKNGIAGEERHLVRTDGTVSWCGFSVASPANWKPNTKKSDCHECTELEINARESEDVARMIELLDE